MKKYLIAVAIATIAIISCKSKNHSHDDDSSHQHEDGAIHEHEGNAPPNQQEFTIDSSGQHIHFDTTEQDLNDHDHGDKNGHSHN